MHPSGFTPRHPLCDTDTGTPRHPLASSLLAAGSAAISGPPALSARGLGPGGAPFGATKLRCHVPKVEAERFPDAPPTVIFVLGGPGAGKSTYCAKIAGAFRCVHVSVDDLLRQERERPGSEHAPLLEEHLARGAAAPGEVVLPLLKRAMQDSGQWKGGKFLLDGFPSTYAQLTDFRAYFGETVNEKTCMFFDVSEANLEERLLALADGAAGDARGAARQQIARWREDSTPVVKQFQYEGVFDRIDANRVIEKVWDELQQFMIVENFKDANAGEKEITSPYKAIWKLRDKQSQEMFPTSHSHTSTSYVKGEHARGFSSFQLLERHRDKHTRSLTSPTDNFVEPMTLSQEIGWHPPAGEGQPLGAKGCPPGQSKPRFFSPRNTCAMTRHMENMYSTNAQHIIRRW